MYICLNRGTLGGGLPLEKFVQLAADAGFQGADVDLGYGLQHGAPALLDLYQSHHMRFGGWGPPVDQRTDPSRRAEGLKKLDQLAAIAHDVGIDSCCTWIMPSSDQPFQETWAAHVEALRPVAQVLGERGMRLGLECVTPFHLRRAKKHEFIYTPGLMLELCDAVGPNVGLLIDVWHMHHACVPWKQIAELPARKIVWVHLSDAPNLPPEQIRDGQRLLPGQGIIDLRGFFAALKQAGYDGPVSLEAFNAVKGLPQEEAAKRAWSACEHVAKEAGIL